MAELRLSRRPAILSPARAETIIGDEDPVAASEIARPTAWTLLGIPDEDFDLEAATRLRSLVCAQGPDIVAHLWPRNPELTLPGVSWRLHLFAEQCERDLPLVKDRYKVGRQAETVSAEMEVLSEVPLLEPVIEDAKVLLRGELTDNDLGRVAVQVAITIRVLAASEGGEGSWITDSSNPLTHMVTTRAWVLSKTIEGSDFATREVALGDLEQCLGRCELLSSCLWGLSLAYEGSRGNGREKLLAGCSRDYEVGSVPIEIVGCWG